MRPVLQINGFSPQSCTTGFLVEERYAEKYVLYDWVTGKARWHIDLADSSSNYISRINAISPDGHLFVAVSGADTTNLCLNVWKEGRIVKVYHWKKPPPPPPTIRYQKCYGVMVHDDGSVLTWFPVKDGIGLLGHTVDGHDVSGHIPCKLPIDGFTENTSIEVSSDNRLLLLEKYDVDFKIQAQCWKIDMLGNRIISKPCALRAHPDQRIALFPKQVLLDQSL